jgi:hypothetical protein
VIDINTIQHANSTKNRTIDVGSHSSRTPIKYSSTRSKQAESKMDVGYEGNPGRVNQSESSINRTPKSEINQPGKIFEQSKTREGSISLLQ